MSSLTVRSPVQSCFSDLCQLIALGKSLRFACEQFKVPPSSVIWVINRDAELAKQYAQAREQQAQVWADEVVDIADEATPDDAQVARLRVDARKWVAAKLLPKKYGDQPQ